MIDVMKFYILLKKIIFQLGRADNRYHCLYCLKVPDDTLMYLKTTFLAKTTN